MASPQVAGMVALAAQYLEEHDLAEKTGFSPRQLAQSLLMSTAEPMNRTKDTYWSILQPVSYTHLGCSHGRYVHYTTIRVQKSTPISIFLHGLRKRRLAGRVWLEKCRLCRKQRREICQLGHPDACGSPLHESQGSWRAVVEEKHRTPTPAQVFL